MAQAGTSLWTIWGNLGQDGKTYDTQRGPVTRVSVAVMATGSKDPVWVSAVGFGNMANEMYGLKKGDAVRLVGETALNTWTDKQTNQVKSEMYLRVFHVAERPAYNEAQK